MAQLTIDNVLHYFCIGRTLENADLLSAVLTITPKNPDSVPEQLTLDLHDGSKIHKTGEITAMNREGGLWITCKPMLAESSPVKTVTLELTARNGSLEALGLPYGVMYRDRTGAYVPKWEEKPLRFRKISFDAFRIQDKPQLRVMLTDAAPAKPVIPPQPAAVIPAQSPAKPADSPARQPAAPAKQHAPQSLPAQSGLAALIRADRSILQYYQAEEQAQALQLLTQAEQQLSADPDSAARLTAQAEELIRQMLARAMQQLRAYRGEKR